MIYSFEDPKIIDALFFLILGILGEFITYDLTHHDLIQKI